MRIIVKFSAALLVGTCGILAANAVYAYDQEVRYFEADMRLDHMVLGDTVAAMMRETWAEQGKAEAMQVPHAIDRGDRHLTLRTIDPAADGPDWRALAPDVRGLLVASRSAVMRDRGFQHSFLPVAGPERELLVLEVSEPLAEERAFSRGSMLRTAAVTVAVVVLCGALTFVLGLVWVDRPIRTLCDGARRIGEGDLSGNLSVPGNSELSLLAGEINAMCRSLAQARERLATATGQRIAALEQLRHADRLATVGRLAAGIAHELGTPLNVVWAQADMIARGELRGPEVVEGAGTIVRQAERMTAIIRQLLHFARPRPPVKAPTDLVGLARQTLQFVETMAQKRGVRLACVGSATEAVTAVDAAQLQQVLTNLLVNAIQATPAGGSVEVDVARQHAQPPDDHGGPAGVWLRIDVRDTGAGIAAEHLPRLFEPFFTTKDVGEGTGLGLSVARGIVREHGGWIAVASAPGQGSCFSVFLPTGNDGGAGRCADAS